MNKITKTKNFKKLFLLPFFLIVIMFFSTFMFVGCGKGEDGTKVKFISNLENLNISNKVLQKYIKQNIILFKKKILKVDNDGFDNEIRKILKKLNKETEWSIEINKIEYVFGKLDKNKTSDELLKLNEKQKIVEFKNLVFDKIEIFGETKGGVDFKARLKQKSLIFEIKINETGQFEFKKGYKLKLEQIK